MSAGSYFIQFEINRKQIPPSQAAAREAKTVCFALGLKLRKVIIELLIREMDVV